MIEKEILKGVSPMNSPVLEKYEKLKKDFKMPSRVLIEIEKKHYRKHINNIRNAARTVVNKVKTEARILAKEIIIENVSLIK